MQRPLAVGLALHAALVVAGAIAAEAAQVQRTVTDPIRTVTAAPYTDDGQPADLIVLSESVAATLGQVALEESVRIVGWPIAPGVTRTVLVARHDVYAPEAKILEQRGGRWVELPRSPLRFFWGAAEDDEYTRVLIVHDPRSDAVHGFTNSLDGVHELLATTSAGSGQLLAPSTSLMQAASGGVQPTWTCGQGQPGNESLLLPPFRSEGQTNRAISSLHTATVAVDTDNELFANKFAESTSTATDYFAQLFAGMSVMYERDLLVRLLQGMTFLRPTAIPDPYPSPVGTSTSAGLNEFVNYWNANQTSVTRAVAAMFSGKANPPVSGGQSIGGIAYVGALCNGSFGYSFNQLFYLSTNPLSHLSSEVRLVGHEIGHNFGSYHTHCTSNGAGGFVDNCISTTGGAGLSPACYEGPTSCPTAATYQGVPNVLGSVMSYCHFGSVPQPCSSASVFHPTVIGILNPKVETATLPAGGACVLSLGPVVNSFTVLPTVATGPGTATLNWATTNATGVTISGVAGPLPTSGSTTVNFTQTTTYTLTATSTFGFETASVTVTVTGKQANLSLTLTDSPDPVGDLQPLAYTLNVANAGPDTATSVTVADTLPGGTGFVAASGSGWTCGEAGGVVTCTRPTLAAASAPSISVMITAPGIPTTLTNQATVSASESDPDPSDNSPSEQTTVVERTRVLSIDDVAVTEGNVGFATAIFRVSLSPASGSTVSVSYATADGSATPSDYLPFSGLLTFLAGEINKSVSIAVSADTQPETNETFQVNLSNPTNATIADSQGIGTIIDDDGAPTPSFRIDDRAVAECAAVNASFSVVLSPASASTVTVDYATSDLAATAAGDYSSNSGRLTFTPGRTSHSVYVPIVCDAVSEGAETFQMVLSNPVGATISRATAIGTIEDPPAAAKIPMYRSYNPGTDYHFFTTDLASKDFAVNVLGFQDESTPIPFYLWNVAQTGTVPLFRMYNPNLGRHFYTASAASRDFIMGIGGVYEKEEGWVYPLSTTPVPAAATELFLLYNNNSGTHLFTADASVKDTILFLFPGVWVQHTSVGYVFTNP